MQVKVCEECGQPYDPNDSGSSLCQDCVDLIIIKKNFKQDTPITEPK